ncbi:MAG: hypothetical protein AB1599_01600 [Planctomycetota bacterium]
MNKNGITLVLVLLILTALILLGIPFAVSMLFKEKTSKDTLHITQSRMAASGARNSAINLLLRTHNFYEMLPNPAAPFDTPDYDTIDEMETDLAQLNIPNIADSKGIIWSSYAEDEQGKINILTAPRRVVDYLQSIIKPNEDLQHFVTEYSYRSTPWVGAQNLAGYRRYLAVDGNEYDIIYVDNAVPCGSEEGLRVRLYNGSEEVIAYVTKEPCPICKSVKEIPDKINGVTGRHRTGEWDVTYLVDEQIWRRFSILGPTSSYRIWLDRKISDTLLTEATMVEIEQPHPVNINTAPNEVLLALFTGVGRRVYNLGDMSVNDSTVSPDQAQALIDEIRQSPVAGFPYLEEIISNTLTSDTQKKDFTLNVFYPRDASYLESYMGIDVTPKSLSNILERRFNGTMPLCYRSFDIYTLNSTGIVNYPSGNQASVTTINEVVDIAPVSDVISWSIESQYDFDKEFYTFLGNPLRTTTYGALTDTYMTNLGGLDSTVASRNPATARIPSYGMGLLKLRAAEDYRGRNITGTTYTYPDTYDGVLTAQNFSRDSIFQFAVDDTPNDIYAGGVEFWIKFNNIPAAAELFNIKQEDYENRLALWYENNELVLSVCDATMDRKAAQIRALVSFTPDIWYHIGAFWHGTKYAQLALLVDGRPIGSFRHYDADTGENLLTQLTADVPDLNGMDTSQSEMTISVTSTTGFPDAGVIEIGTEVIEYISTTGNGFIVQTIWEVLTPTQLASTGRGSRDTSIVSHTAGANVTIYGYANPFDDEFPISVEDKAFILPCNTLLTGGATLVDTIPITSPDYIIVNMPDGQIGVDDTTIPITTVLVTMTISIPPKGYVRIDNEVIYYDSYITGTSTLEGCQRGAEGTTASTHNGFSPANPPLKPEPTLPSFVKVFSIRVSDTTNYNSPTFIQIDNEWFGPVQKAITNTEFFIGPITGGAPTIFGRGWVSDPSVHSFGAQVIPVFVTKYPYTGKGDTVTIIESDQTSNPKEEKTVKNAMNKRLLFVPIFTGNQIGTYRSYGPITNTPPTLFAFNDNLSRNYPVDGTVTRILKFPSGELPSYLPDTFTIGANITGTATVDEIKFYCSPRGNYVITETLLASESGKTTILLNNIPAGSGLVKIGDEYVGFATVSGTSLSDCSRGYLNTPVQTHDSGQRIFDLTRFLPITALSQGITANGYAIPLNSSSGFANSGYVLLGNDFNNGEVAGYLQVSGSQLLMPAHSNGIFRAMFGTTVQAHPANTLCYGIPFRYWHLEKLNAFDSQMAYFQAAHSARGATWQRLYWDETDTDNQVRLRFLVRFDNQPAWNTIPDNQPGGIFEFTDPNGPNDLNVKADQIEVMVFFQYLPGALSGDGWKRSPLLENIYVDYKKPSVVTIARQER